MVKRKSWEFPEKEQQAELAAGLRATEVPLSGATFRSRLAQALQNWPGGATGAALWRLASPNVSGVFLATATSADIPIWDMSLRARLVMVGEDGVPEPSREAPGFLEVDVVRALRILEADSFVLLTSDYEQPWELVSSATDHAEVLTQSDVVRRYYYHQPAQLRDVLHRACKTPRLRAKTRRRKAEGAMRDLVQHFATLGHIVGSPRYPEQLVDELGQSAFEKAAAGIS